MKHIGDKMALLGFCLISTDLNLNLDKIYTADGSTGCFLHVALRAGVTLKCVGPSMGERQPPDKETACCNNCEDLLVNST